MRRSGFLALAARELGEGGVDYEMSIESDDIQLLGQKFFS